MGAVNGWPVEPEPSSFEFPPVGADEPNGRVVVGGDLRPGTLLAAYRTGLFPMRDGSGQLAWWSPDPRAVLPVSGLVVSKSLRRSRQRFSTTIDTCFDQVVAACSERAPGEYEWITQEIKDAYSELHRLGWAHSVETWSLSQPSEPAELVGGLYGVAVGGLFSGESMFHRRTDASKVALVALVEALRHDSAGDAERMIDVQWLTPHMASLGAVEIARDEYLRRLRRAMSVPVPHGLMVPSVDGHPPRTR